MTGYTTGSGNRLTSDGTYNYEYDNEGNLLVKVRISDGQRTENTWDYRNRLTRIVVKDAQGNIIKEGRYTYDVDDRRIGVWEDADGAGAGEPTQRWTAYDGPNPWADFDENGSLTTRYLYGPAIDQLFARLATGQEPEWYLGDYLGSVRQIVKTDGTVLEEITYDSFGQILSETNPENGDRFKYTAREWDALFGQYYYRVRYYGPDVGRFISQDPLGFEAGDPNLYRYVKNNPTNFTDPLGLQAVAEQDPVNQLRETARRNNVPDEYIERLLQAIANTSVFWGSNQCDRWCERFLEVLRGNRIGPWSGSNDGVISICPVTWNDPHGILGMNHVVIEITFRDKTVICIDNGYLGRNSHIFLPSCIPNNWERRRGWGLWGNERFWERFFRHFADLGPSW